MSTIDPIDAEDENTAKTLGARHAITSKPYQNNFTGKAREAYDASWIGNGGDILEVKSFASMSEDEVPDCWHCGARPKDCRCDGGVGP